jgi:hypothetical protein
MYTDGGQDIDYEDVKVLYKLGKTLDGLALQLENIPKWKSKCLKTTNNQANHLSSFLLSSSYSIIILLLASNSFSPLFLSFFLYFSFVQSLKAISCTLATMKTTTLV